MNFNIFWCVTCRKLSIPSLVLLFGFVAWSPADAQEPDRPGEFSVATADYDLGDEAIMIEGFDSPHELRARVYYPETDGQFPLVVIMHGRHWNVFRGSQARYSWPPTDGFQALPNYLGHDQLARHMASHGFVVATISANAIATNDNGRFPSAFVGQVVRARLIQEHLRFLSAANDNESENELDGQLVGRIDMDQIGLLGHSRGAEAILVNHVINKGDGATQLSLNDEPEFDIDAVFSCAPTLFVPLRIEDVPMAVMIGYCDGDTDLPGVRHYDGSNYSKLYFDIDSADEAPKHLIYVMGANHAYFNENWIPNRFPAGTEDDVFEFSSARRDCQTLPFYSRKGGLNFLSGRIEASTQLRVLDSYATGFFETYLKGETHSVAKLTGEDTHPYESLSLDPDEILVSYTGPDVFGKRFDICRFDNQLQSRISSGFGTPITYSGFEDRFLRGGPRRIDDGVPRFATFLNHLAQEDPNDDLFVDSNLEPHSRNFGPFGAGAMRLITGPTEDGKVNFEVSDNLSRLGQFFDAIQLRVGVHFENEINTLQDAAKVCWKRKMRQRIRRYWGFGSVGILPDADLRIELQDADGNRQSISAEQYSAALFIPPGNPNNSRLVMNQVRIPLNAYTNIDLNKLTDINIVVGPDNDLQISDVALVSSDPFVGGN